MIGHAVAHVGIDCHPEVPHLNFTRCRVWHRNCDDFEIVCDGHAGGSRLQTNFTRRYHNHRFPLSQTDTARCDMDLAKPSDRQFAIFIQATQSPEIHREFRKRYLA